MNEISELIVMMMWLIKFGWLICCAFVCGADFRVKVLIFGVSSLEN